MHELDRIEEALTKKRLDPQVFERCATDLLSEIFPGLTPIPGGTDRGRDGDIHTADGSVPMRLLVTASRSYKNIRENLVNGLKSMIQNGLSFDRIVLANPAQLNEQEREKLRAVASSHGATIEAIFERGYFSSRLRRDGEWRSRLLGLSSTPITLSRVPAALAESPWAFIPLVGRDDEMVALGAVEEDIIIAGPPGVGKTRVVSELEEVFFVDPGASRERLHDDLLWLQPKYLVVDDAGQSEELIKHLSQLRHVESDVLGYKIIAICWPDEADRLLALLTNASVLNVDLLERRAMDQILTDMGISSVPARQEILDQAEGRPGWAIALGDMLIKTLDAVSLLSGSALLGQVNRYLLRAQVRIPAIDILSIIAVLDGITETEITKLANELGRSRLDVVNIINASATSGLVDVHSFYDGESRRYIRRYTVRPPMLAKALVVEKAFYAPAPTIDFMELARAWPERIFKLAEAAIDCALLGSPEAKPIANRLFAPILGSAEVPRDIKWRLAKSYSMIDTRTGTDVLAAIRSEFDEITASKDFDPRTLEPLVELATAIARRHQLPDAVELLMDAAVCDQRATNSAPEHPIRQLEALVQEFYPTIPPSFEYRQLVLDAAEGWINRDAEDPIRWSVYLRTIRAILSFECTSGYSSPGDPLQYNFLRATLTPEVMARIYDELWPRIQNRLSTAPEEVLSDIVDTANDWLRIGSGNERLLGQALPQPKVKMARRLGSRLVKDLVQLISRSEGAKAYLKRIARIHSVAVAIPQGKVEKVFLADIDLAAGREESEKNLQESIESITKSWVKEDPEIVLNRLFEMKNQISLARIRWPPRIDYAISQIAKTVPDPIPWIRLALEIGMFPEAGPLVSEAVTRKLGIPSDLVRGCLANDAARWAMINAVLIGETGEEQLGIVLHDLQPSDYRLIEVLFFRGELSDSRVSDLLCRTSDPTRAAVAAAMFCQSRRDQEWTPGAFERVWREALQHLDFAVTTGLDSEEVKRLFEYLIRTYPDDVFTFFENRLASAKEGAVYSAVTMDLWDVLYLLPANLKTRLWNRFTANEEARSYLSTFMVGDDVTWLASMLESGDMSIEDALDSHDGHGIDPSIEDLARLLVPRHVDPRRVAYLAEPGSWSGEPSGRYERLTQRFQTMADSDDPSIKAVGVAGVEIYTKARKQALKKEKKKRIRGEL